jgi:hypothetical protein
MKHTKHLKHAFSVRNVSLLFGRITKLNAGAKVDDSAWSSPVRP